MTMASNLRVWRIIYLLFIVVFFCPFAYDKVIYVDDDATGANDGTSWQNAYTFLQDALADAETAEKPVEIRVAQGTYTPDENSVSPDGTGDRDARFKLINNVTIKGGYAGFGETDPNARDIEACETFLSGDLNGDDVIVNDPCDLRDAPNRGDNSSNVVTGSNTDATAILDGFTIIGGDIWMVALSIDGEPIGGAGMLISSGSSTLIDCTFTDNETQNSGGGLLLSNNSNPTLLNCKFTRNYAESGGGIFCSGSSPTLINCTFNANYTHNCGGGMCNSASNPTLIDCTFNRNSSFRRHTGSDTLGGGMYNRKSSPVLTNCTFSENSADRGGGMRNGSGMSNVSSMYNEDGSNPTLTNCTFKDNSADYGGGLSNVDDCNLTLTNCVFICNSAKPRGGGMSNRSSNTTLINCIFIGNKAHDWSMTGVTNIIPGYGGGMSTGGNPTLINCTFLDNWASQGAGIYNGGEPTLTRCTFSGNLAQNGGGMFNSGSGPELTINFCTFSGNFAELGGGIFYSFNARMKIANCTFADNLASNGNAIAAKPTEPSLPGYIELTNCILWDGDNTIFDPRADGSTTVITYSDVQGGWPGEGNIDADPCFADPGYWADADDPNSAVEPDDLNAVWIDGDYHLKSQAGRWDPVSESWVVDDVTSPCIDAGGPNSPIGHEPFPNGGVINMGAYGGTAEASKSPSGLHAKYGGGTGEHNNPYLIYTAEHMNTVGLHEQDWDKHFMFMANIDLSPYTGTDFNIIGYWVDWNSPDNKPFAGLFDGNGYAIYNFTYTSKDIDRTGLFGYVDDENAQIKDLGLIDPNIDARIDVGSLVGRLNKGTITNCYVEGGSITGNHRIGGLVGHNLGTITNCYVNANVTGGDYIGGLVGYNYEYSRISGCYSTGRISGREDVGGLVGINRGIITNCYAIGSVSGSKIVGGFAGSNGWPPLPISRPYPPGDITNCYSTGSVSGNYQVGGLVGKRGYGSVTASFWDTETSGQTTSAGGIGKTTAEMQTAGTFIEAGWDFVDETTNGTEDIWWILEGQDYPRLWWEPIE